MVCFLGGLVFLGFFFIRLLYVYDSVPLCIYEKSQNVFEKIIGVTVEFDGGDGFIIFLLKGRRWGDGGSFLVD